MELLPSGLRRRDQDLTNSQFGATLGHQCWGDLSMEIIHWLS